MKYKAAIFDLDGTIADTVESIAYVGNRTLAHFGLPAIPVKDYNFYAGDGADELVRRMLAAVPGRRPQRSCWHALDTAGSAKDKQIKRGKLSFPLFAFRYGQ